MKILFLFFSISFIYSCKANTQNRSNNEEKNIANNDSLNFDKILKCIPYSFNDNYFMTADNGCLYNPKGPNTFGNIIVYLIPKKTLIIKDEDIGDENKKINTLNINDYKKIFDIYVFMIDKKFLFYNPKADPIYYQREKFSENLYTYNIKTDKWDLSDSIRISSRSENIKEQKWREGFIISQQKKSTQKNLIQIKNIQIVYNKMNADSFLLIKESECDLNKDRKKDKILIFEPKDLSKIQDSVMMNSPIWVLLNQGDGSYKTYKNYKIIYTLISNCPSEGFTNLVIKDNYFTIEQRVCGGWYLINNYTTFKWDEKTNSIVLHKYGKLFTERRDPNKQVPDVIYTIKDFGTIFFEDFTPDAIKRK